MYPQHRGSPRHAGMVSMRRAAASDPAPKGWWRRLTAKQLTFVALLAVFVVLPNVLYFQHTKESIARDTVHESRADEAVPGWAHKRSLVQGDEDGFVDEDGADVREALPRPTEEREHGDDEGGAETHGAETHDTETHGTETHDTETHDAQPHGAQAGGERSHARHAPPLPASDMERDEFLLGKEGGVVADGDDDVRAREEAARAQREQEATFTQHLRHTGAITDPQQQETDHTTEDRDSFLSDVVGEPASTTASPADTASARGETEREFERVLKRKGVISDPSLDVDPSGGRNEFLAGGAKTRDTADDDDAVAQAAVEEEAVEKERELRHVLRRKEVMSGVGEGNAATMERTRFMFKDGGDGAPGISERERRERVAHERASMNEKMTEEMEFAHARSREQRDGDDDDDDGGGDDGAGRHGGGEGGDGTDEGTAVRESLHREAFMQDRGSAGAQRHAVDDAHEEDEEEDDEHEQQEDEDDVQWDHAAVEAHRAEKTIVAHPHLIEAAGEGSAAAAAAVASARPASMTDVAGRIDLIVDHDGAPSKDAAAGPAAAAEETREVVRLAAAADAERVHTLYDDGDDDDKDTSPPPTSHTAALTTTATTTTPATSSSSTTTTPSSTTTTTSPSPTPTDEDTARAAAARSRMDSAGVSSVGAASSTPAAVNVEVQGGSRDSLHALAEATAEQRRRTADEQESRRASEFAHARAEEEAQAVEFEVQQSTPHDENELERALAEQRRAEQARAEERDEAERASALAAEAAQAVDIQMLKRRKKWERE